MGGGGGSLETKFAETAGQMTVGHIRSYKFVRCADQREEGA